MKKYLFDYNLKDIINFSKKIKYFQTRLKTKNRNCRYRV